MSVNTERSYLSREQVATAEIDLGLRRYMLQVYNYMASGLALTGLVAYAAASSETLMATLFGTPLMWVVLLAPVGLAMFMSMRIAHLRASTAQAIFWVYAGLMGLSLASIFLVYTGSSIARVFFITASTFAATSIYGYTTKRDLSGFGSFLFMGLIGLMIASIVNIFLHSTAMDWVISAAGVLIFTGLTAYDTQRIKEMYLDGDDSETYGKKAVMGALTLYLDFINLFIMLLRFLGDRR